MTESRAVFRPMPAGKLIPHQIAELARMSYRQFMWGLSNGVLILTLAGGFWLGIIGSIVHRPEIFGPVGVVGLALLLWGFRRLRRKSAGFSLADMKNETEEQRNSLRQIRRGLRRAFLIEAV